MVISFLNQKGGVGGGCEPLERRSGSWRSKQQLALDFAPAQVRSGLGRRKGTAGRDQLILGGGSMTQAQMAALHGVSKQTVSYVVHRAGHSNAARIAARNKSIREDPRTNAELASEHGLTVRRIRQIRNQN